MTGRSIEEQYVDSQGTAIRCDHRDDQQVRAVFRRIVDQEGPHDILVNNTWRGYENMIEAGEFTWPALFGNGRYGVGMQCSQVGVRSAYVASQMAARVMVEQSSGLIANISFWAALKFVGNVAYGVSKAATDKMTADMSHETRKHNVAVVSLYPGLARTEKVMQSTAWLDLSNSESPQFVGRAVVALAADPRVMERTGSVVVGPNWQEIINLLTLTGNHPDH